ncbi:MAG: thiolase family protein [Vicinamibacterales bacterium]|nr:thiolase family protein [Vicinamibacterales bacterium]
MREVAIIGVGMHKFGRFPGVSIKELSRIAVWNAIRDAGIDAKAVQCAYVGNCFQGALEGQHAARGHIALRSGAGLSGLPIVNVESGTASGSLAFRQAWMAVGSGLYDVGLALGMEKMSASSTAQILAAMGGAVDVEVGGGRMGLTFVGEFAALVDKLMRQYGWTQRQMAKVAAKNFYNASLNPNAEYYQQPFDVEAVMKAPVVSFPMTRLMSCSAKVDGAAAIIVCAKEALSKYTTRKPVHVAACEQRSVVFYDFRKPETLPLTYAHDPIAVMQAYKTAGAGPKDMEIAQCHDAFSIEEMMSYEALGFCKPGEGGRMIDEGRTSLKGDIPYNTDGGLLARGNPIGATGPSQICEMVWQIRGEAGARQVPGRDGKGPKIGVIHNAGGGPIEDAVASLIGIVLKR